MIYTRARIHTTARRHKLDLAAQCLREEIHYSRLGGEMTLSRGAEIARAVAQRFDEFLVALDVEVRGEAIGPKDEPIYDAAEIIAIRFEERDREIRSAADGDPRADLGCWEYHQGADAWSEL